MLKFFDRVASTLQTSLRNIAVLGAVALLVMTIDITVDVVGRATGKAVVGIAEFNMGMLAIFIFLGIGYAQTAKKHISVSAITQHLPKTVAAILECLSLVLSLGLCSFCCYLTTRVAIEKVAIGEFLQGGIDMPLWPMRIIVATGWALLSLQLIVDLARSCGKASREVRSALSRPRMKGGAINR